MTYKQRVFLTDIDGTLDFKGQGITQAVTDQARLYIAGGGRLGLATGRALLSTEQIARSIGVNAPSILYGGSMVYDFANAAVLWLCPLDVAILSVVDEIMHRCGDVAVLVYTDRSIHILQANDMLWQKGIKAECNRSFCNNHVSGQLLKLNLCGPRASLQAIRDTFFTGDDYTFAFSSQHFAEVVARNAGKGKALQTISRLTGTSLDRFIVMGDGQNDLELMHLAGFAYAVGNAIDAVKAAADIVLPPCAEDGAAQGFIHAKHYFSDEAAAPATDT